MAAMSGVDTVREVHTPEGVALRLPVAGPVPRALAWLIDTVIRIAGLILLIIIVGRFGKIGEMLILIGAFALMWLYPILFECLWSGQTPGKRALELRVVMSDGVPVGWLASISRNLLRILDFLPLYYGVGLVVGYLDGSHRRLGDLVGRTVVIHAPRVRPPVLAAGEGVMAPLRPLQPQEQAAVVAFSERAPRLTPERQAELADIAAPIVGVGGPEGVHRLRAVANWLLGRA